MNGIWVETKDRVISQPAAFMPSKDGLSIAVSMAPKDGWRMIAEYQTESARDRAWAMLENAIATGVRLFRFPTDAEVEGQEE